MPTGSLSPEARSRGREGAGRGLGRLWSCSRGPGPRHQVQPFPRPQRESGDPGSGVHWRPALQLGVEGLWEVGASERLLGPRPQVQEEGWSRF